MFGSGEHSRQIDVLFDLPPPTPPPPKKKRKKREGGKRLTT